MHDICWLNKPLLRDDISKHLWNHHFRPTVFAPPGLAFEGQAKTPGGVDQDPMQVSDLVKISVECILCLVDSVRSWKSWGY